MTPPGNAGGEGGGGEGHRPHEARQFVCARALTLHRLGLDAKWVHGTHVPSL